MQTNRLFVDQVEIPVTGKNTDIKCHLMDYKRDEKIGLR